MDVLSDRVEKIEIRGSVSKGTDIKALSDVDAFLLMDKFYLDSSPKYVKAGIKRLLENRFPK